MISKNAASGKWIVIALLGAVVATMVALWVVVDRAKRRAAARPHTAAQVSAGPRT